jgi:DNA-binding CsgD family transcriptional regulator/catechol 2,3-dioxygenase-like lactoylglutathione lyase family enzyme
MTGESKRGRPPHDDILTPAEWRVVEAVRHGLTNPAIARAQGVTIDAVKFHLANAMAKLGLSGRADIRRWNGISRASKLHGKEQEMNQPIALGALGQVSRQVRDIAAARAWYGDVLGLQHLYSFGNLAFFDCGGTCLFLSENTEAGAESILYFRVPDIRAAHEQLAAKGVEFLQAPHMIHRHDDGTEEWMAFFNDPEGRPLAIMSQVR